MTYIRVLPTIPCALMLSLAVALPVTAQTCPSMCRDFGNTALGNAALLVNTTGAALVSMITIIDPHLEHRPAR